MWLSSSSVADYSIHMKRAITPQGYPLETPVWLCIFHTVHGQADVHFDVEITGTFGQVLDGGFGGLGKECLGHVLEGRSTVYRTTCLPRTTSTDF